MRNSFHEVDVNFILSTYISKNQVRDRIAWTHSTDGKYSVKSGYQFCQAQATSIAGIEQSGGWKKLWNLDVPHKIRYSCGASVVITFQ